MVWDGCSERDSQTLQKIQNEAARLVTGLTRSVSLENLYKEYGLLTLSQRRKQHKHSFMYNVNAGLLQSYILDLIPPLVSEISDNPFRNKKSISLPYKRINISQKSCTVYFHLLDYGMTLKMILKLINFNKLQKICNVYVHQVIHSIILYHWK